MGCRVGRREVDGVTAADELGCDGGGDGRLADPAFAHRQDDSMSHLRNLVDQLREWERARGERARSHSLS